MNTQNYVCPNCQGKGCPLCQNTGKLTLSDQEVQELQKLMTKTMPQNQMQTDFGYNGTFDSPNNEKRLRGQVAGILTLVFLALVSISGFLSWYFTRTFKPFLQFWTTVIIIGCLKPVSSLEFFREKPINDYFGALNNERIKIKKSFLYPLF